jgi:type II secretory pathway component HofQ
VGRDNMTCHIDADVDADAGGNLTMVASVDGAEVQRQTLKFAPPAIAAGRRIYKGEPLSMNLRNADLRDVLRTFGQLTGLEITVAPEISGTVNVNFTDTPWDEALDDILKANGLTYRLEGKKLHVIRAGS